jgi:hypothetical protein
MLRDAWRALGGDESACESVRVVGDVGLRSPYAVGALALGAVGAGRLAAEELMARGRTAAPVVLDAAHIGLAFRSERYARLGGKPAGAGFAPLSRFWRTADGWLRLHANYVHHRAAAERVLGPDPLASAARWNSLDLEKAVVGAGGVAAAVREESEWAAHPQGRAVRDLPLLALNRVGDAPARVGGLRGLRVLDLTRVIAGPVGTRTLASYGADVLRLESPRLAEDAATLVDTGPGKRHALLDLDVPDDLARLESLLEDADVVVQGYRPGALAARGLGAADLTERFPGLVVVTLCAWGSAGPWAGRRGFDSIVQAACGIAHATRSADGTPGVLPAQALDHATGHLIAATVMRAVTRQREEGGSWHGELSLAQTARWLLDAPRVAVEHAAPEVDPQPYLVDLPSPSGTATLLRPPGSPTWTRGPVPAGHDPAEWRTGNLVPRARPEEGGWTA